VGDFETFGENGNLYEGDLVGVGVGFNLGALVGVGDGLILGVFVGYFDGEAASEALTLELNEINVRTIKTAIIVHLETEYDRVDDNML